MNARALKALVSALLVATVAACGGSDDAAAPPPAPTTLSGTAAIGAPVVGGTVTVRCATGSAIRVTTTAGGAWSAALDGQAFPCLVAVSGGNVPAGQTLYSMAVDTQDLNVTPLTTLVLAAAFGDDPANLTTLPTLDAAREALEEGVTKVTAFLESSGYASVPANPFTDTFAPVAGDPYDDLLEQIARSLEDAGITPEQLIEEVASGEPDVTLPLTHVFSASELAAMPKLNKVDLTATGDELTMSVLAGTNPVGAFVGGGNGNKAVLQLPGLAGTKLADFRSMTLDVKGPPRVGGKNVYVYVNMLVDLQCDGTPLPANATLADVRAKRRLLIYDPYHKYVQQNPLFNESAFTTMDIRLNSPGWRITAGTSVGTGVAINPNYVGHETLEGFDFATYPNACIVDAASGDGGLFRNAGADPACNTTAALSATAPAACGKAHSGVTVILGDSNTDFAASWKVKNIRFEANTVRNYRFQ